MISITKTISVNLPTRNTLNKVSETVSRASKWMDKYFITREAKLMGASAVTAGLASLVLGDLPINFVSKSLNICGLAERDGWIHLNAPGLALYAAATVPVYQIVSKIIGRPVKPDNSVNFKPSEALSIAGGAYSSYLVTKGMETVISGTSWLFHAGSALLSPLRTATPIPLSGTSLFLGITGGGMISSGVVDYRAQSKEQKDTKDSQIKMAIGAACLGLMVLKTAYDYMYLEEDVKASEWSWVDLNASSMASMNLVITPIFLITNRIFNKILDNPKMPKMPSLVRKGINIIPSSLAFLGSLVVGDYLKLPGISLRDPYATLIGSILARAQGFALVEVLPQVLNKVLPDEADSNNAMRSPFNFKENKPLTKQTYSMMQERFPNLAGKAS